MATDAQILAAARELTRAIEAHRLAVDARKIKDGEAMRAIAHEEDSRKRVIEAQTWLINAGKTAGPEPTPVKPVTVAETIARSIGDAAIAQAIQLPPKPADKPKKVPELPAPQSKKAAPMTWADNRQK